jgi:hypothetical protein
MLRLQRRWVLACLPSGTLRAATSGEPNAGGKVELLPWDDERQRGGSPATETSRYRSEAQTAAGGRRTDYRYGLDAAADTVGAKAR